jgi:hypothetical protein
VAPLIEWARRWLGVTHLEAQVRLLTLEVRRLERELDAERQRRDEAVASLGAATFAERPADAVARIVDVLRRWR